MQNSEDYLSKCMGKYLKFHVLTTLNPGMKRYEYKVVLSLNNSIESTGNHESDAHLKMVLI